MNAITSFSANAASRIAAIIIPVLLTVVLAAPAQAGVVITGTRVVYPAKEKEVTVRFENKNQTPTLVQVWLDDGDEQVAPEQAHVPFIIAPPIFRMEPDKRHVVRLVYTGEPLPADKESLYWFNMLEVPPKAQNNEESNQLQIAFRTRIKLFFRPAGLAYEPNQAPAKLQWKLASTDQGQALEVHNPTPYYISFEQVELVAGGQRHAKPAGESGTANMVGPGESNLFPLPTLASTPRAAAEVEFQILDDYGIKSPHKAKLMP